MPKEVMEKLKEHDKKFDRIDQKFDSLTEIVMENKNQTTVLGEKMDKLIDTIDHALGNVNRLDQGRYAGIARMDRMQGEIDENALEIKKVKKVLKVA